MTQPEPASDAEKAFGAAVRERRTLLGLTQDQLRRRLLDGHGIDLSKTAMSRLEQGERPIRLNEVTALAQLLEIDLSAWGSPSMPPEREYFAEKLRIARENIRAIDGELAVVSNQLAAAQMQVAELGNRMAELRSKRHNLDLRTESLAQGLQTALDAAQYFEDDHGEH